MGAHTIVAAGGATLDASLLWITESQVVTLFQTGGINVAYCDAVTVTSAQFAHTCGVCSTSQRHEST